MPDDMPIACSLNAAELTGRLAEMAAVGDAALIDAQWSATRAMLSFRDAPGVRSRIEVIVAAESQCCAFLEMSLADRDAGFQLTVIAPEGAEVVLSEMVGAFGAGAGPRG